MNKMESSNVISLIQSENNLLKKYRIAQDYFLSDIFLTKEETVFIATLLQCLCDQGYRA